MTLFNNTISREAGVEISTEEFLRTIFEPVLDENSESPYFLELGTQSLNADGTSSLKTKSYPLSISGMKSMIKLALGRNNKYLQENIYYTVCPRDEQKFDEEKGYPLRTTASNVSLGTTVWADVDSKDFQGGKDEAWSRVSSLKPFPSIVVDTGNGFHLYWLLSGLFDANDVSAICRRVGVWVGGDQVFDKARILRLPGTMNWKEQRNPKMARIIHFDDSVRYTLDDFDHYPVVNHPVPPHMANVSLSNNVPSVNIDELRKKFLDTKLYDKIMAPNLDVYKRIIGTSKAKSRSETDMHICCQLIKSGISHDEIVSIFQSLPCGDKFRQKGRQGISYLRHTLEAAHQRVYDEKLFIERFKGIRVKSEI